MEVKFYKVRDGDYDTDPSAICGVGICKDGLKDLTHIGRKLPDVLYAVFRKDETDNTFEIVSYVAPEDTCLKPRPGERPYSILGDIVLYSQFARECAEAYRKGYRFVEFQVDA